MKAMRENVQRIFKNSLPCASIQVGVLHLAPSHVHVPKSVILESTLHGAGCPGKPGYISRHAEFLSSIVLSFVYI